MKSQRKTIRYDFQLMAALAMVLIVVFHIREATLTGPWRVLNPLVLTRVTSFIFIAGYFAKPELYSLKAFILKKGKSLMLPLYLYTFFFAAVLAVTHAFGAKRGTLSLYAVFVDPLWGGAHALAQLPNVVHSSAVLCRIN